MGDANKVFADLKPALAHHTAGDSDKAHSMSTDMGYHWGQVNADDILGNLPQPQPFPMGEGVKVPHLWREP